MNNYAKLRYRIVLIMIVSIIITIACLFVLFKTDAFYAIDTSSLVDDTYIQWTPTLAVEVARQPEIIQEQLDSHVVDSEAGVIVPGNPDPPTMPPSDGIIQGSGNDAVLAQFLRSLGYNDIAISGAMGNFAAESGLDPRATQGHTHDGQTRPSCLRLGGGDGHGLAQWDSGRRVALIEFATARGKEWWDFSIQLEYFKSEIEGPEKKYGGQAVMNACTSVKEACFQFADKYERCAGAGDATLSKPSALHRWDVRLSSSESYYKWLQTNGG